MDDPQPPFSESATPGRRKTGLAKSRRKTGTRPKEAPQPPENADPKPTAPQPRVRKRKPKRTDQELESLLSETPTPKKPRKRRAPKSENNPATPSAAAPRSHKSRSTAARRARTTKTAPPGELDIEPGQRPGFLRRRWVALLFGSTVGIALGYAGHPWLAGSRKEEFAQAMRHAWDTIKAPLDHERERWARTRWGRKDTDDVKERPQSSVRRPIVLDVEGLAYQTFIAELGLKFIKPMELLRPHFNIRGVVQNTIPPRSLWKKIVPTLRMADALRERLDSPLLTIASAYRSPAYNAACPGAASHSYHTQNMALDLMFACPPSKVAAMAEVLRKEKKFTGGIGRYSTFTHIDTRGKNADWG